MINSRAGACSVHAHEYPAYEKSNEIDQEKQIKLENRKMINHHHHNDVFLFSEVFTSGKT